MAEKNYKFEKLTPTDNVDLRIYEDAMNFAFNDSDVRNIAISGAYSAGKSSLLASYKKKHKEKKFIHISLAHFASENDKGPNKDNDKGPNKDNDKENALEGKIINQLIHQIEPKHIPQTNFKVKNKFNSIRMFLRVGEFIATIVAIFYFLFLDSWKDYILSLPDGLCKSISNFMTDSYGPMVVGIILLAVISDATYNVFKLQHNKNIFHKLKFQGNEIEVFEKHEDSYFDKYLNEVLYIFENAGADIIVFEDIDRFNMGEIFERLREINTLVNNRPKMINCNKTLKFLYLLRDDMFLSKDRTKFFDYIIPVIPVVDSSNSYDQFISLFKGLDIYDKFEKHFLEGLSLYIDDMRLLKNIYNEFIIYFYRLNTTGQDCNRMLAIITYKNLFPHDFSDLQLNKGFVYSLFRKKEAIIKEKSDEIKHRIEKVNKAINEIKKEHLESIHELEALFTYKYLSNSNDLPDYNDVDELRTLLMDNLGSDEKLEMKTRKYNVESKLSKKVDKLYSEIDSLNNELESVRKQKLHQLITRENIDSIFEGMITQNKDADSFNKIKESDYFDLLRYLIRKGYIDETYPDYMTYFYENSLSRIDKIFMRSVTDRRAMEYTYNLKNPALIFSKLDELIFDEEEVLNFDLLTYLLKEKQDSKQLSKLLLQLGMNENFEFIRAYLEVTDVRESFIKNLNRTCPSVFSMLYINAILSETQLHRYSIYSIYNADDDTLELINKDGSLRKYISSNYGYLEIDKPEIDKLINGFKLLNVKFTGFYYEHANKNLFKAVYEASLYEINAENLRLVIIKMLGPYGEDWITQKNYTIIRKYQASKLSDYIEKNINEYFDVMLALNNDEIYDEKESAVYLLNNKELSTKNKQLYIERLRTSMDCIREITDSDLWPTLIANKLIDFSEMNIIEYFGILGLDDILVDYINRSKFKVDFSQVELNDVIKTALLNNVLECEALNNDKYESILTSIGAQYDSFDIEDIVYDKFEILINANIILMSRDNLVFVRECYSKHVFEFIKRNIEQYLELIDYNLFHYDELIEILDWDIIDDYKLKLLNFTDREISIIGKSYTEAVCLHILENNFMVSELYELFSTYEKWNNKIQEKIYELAANDIHRIDVDSASKQLVDKLLHDESIEREGRIDLFVAIVPHTETSYIKDILFLFGLSEFIGIFDKNYKLRLEINDETERILDAFKEAGFIYDFVEDDNKRGFYKIHRRKPRK